MSKIIAPNVTGYIISANDDSVQRSDYRTSPPEMTGAGPDFRYSDILWARVSFPAQLSGNSNGFAGLDSAHQHWEWNFPPTGCHVRKVITGIVKDSSGNPVSGATVMLYNTTTGLLVDTQTSQGDGSYKCGDPNNVASFAVGYKTGSPDTAGATVNTVTGS